eukprot:714150-Pleurochrysis_carterae.AAC.3
MAAACGMDLAEFGGKCWRIGGKTDLRDRLGEGGAALIKQRGHWQSDAAGVYQRAVADRQLDVSADLANATGVDMEALVDGWAQPSTCRYAVSGICRGAEKSGDAKLGADRQRRRRQGRTATECAEARSAATWTRSAPQPRWSAYAREASGLAHAVPAREVSTLGRTPGLAHAAVAARTHRHTRFWVRVTSLRDAHARTHALMARCSTHRGRTVRTTRRTPAQPDAWTDARSDARPKALLGHTHDRTHARTHNRADACTPAHHN